MFIKFLDHDLRYGIGHAKKRLIVTFIMFFFLSIYHFWTLRIFELTDPQYLESPVTTADYFLALIGGCGKVNLISGAENDFVMPTMWFVFVLWMQFTSLYYPFAELNGISSAFEAQPARQSKLIATSMLIILFFIYIVSIKSQICGAKNSYDKLAIRGSIASLYAIF